MGTLRKVLLAILIFPTLWPAFAAAQQPCERLTQLKLDKTTVTSTAVVPAGAFKFPAPTNIVAPSLDLSAYCRVEAVARPTSDSEIKFEVWMPVTGWNGKYLQMGNGGFAGKIPTVAMTSPLHRGYATAGTDDGHTVTVHTDASWALGHREKIIDFGYRAIHLTAVHTKAILRAFYGRDPARAYFEGCSDGGREALMEAQRYPKDFEGIIVGAPANDWTRLMSGFVWNEKALQEDPASWIPLKKLAAVQRAALAACDSLDGVKDGLIEDPRACHFDPHTILCQGSDTAECLTAPQVEALKNIYDGLKNPRTGELLFPGYVAGDEATLWDWPFWIVGFTAASEAAQPQFANQFFSNMMFDNPKWDFHTFDFDKDVTLTDKKMGPILNSNDPNLKPFQAHGGKLIQYHGWSDAAIAPLNSINYYERVAAAMGGGNRDSFATLGGFYRLFMVPGMGHCGGGSGPGDFGDLALGSRLQPHDPDHDVLSALEQWVEGGKAPDKLIATKYNSAKGIIMTRPLCPYPQIAHYQSSGDTNDAANFECRTSKKTE